MAGPDPSEAAGIDVARRDPTRELVPTFPTLAPWCYV